MNVPELLATLVVYVAVPLNVFVAVVLWWLSRQAPDEWTLRERAILATAVTMLVVVFAFVFWNNDMPAPFLDLETTRLITRGAILVLSVGPALYWLWQAWKS